MRYTAAWILTSVTVQSDTILFIEHTQATNVGSKHVCHIGLTHLVCAPASPVSPPRGTQIIYGVIAVRNIIMMLPMRPPRNYVAVLGAAALHLLLLAGTCANPS